MIKMQDDAPPLTIKEFIGKIDKKNYSRYKFHADRCGHPMFFSKEIENL
jgi:hypothetical protein